MSEKYQIIGTERDLRPAYYDSFHCLMSDCKLSCCKDDWQICFSKKDYLKLKKQKGSPELNKRLAHSTRRVRGKNASEDFNYAQFVNQDSCCPLLTEDGLCMLQLECGAKVLPEVCRTFPRSQNYALSGFLERYLSPACEGVLALLWDLPEGVEFRSDPLPEEERYIRKSITSSPLAPHFQAIRSLGIDFLQNRRFALPERILLLGLALKSLAEGETDAAAWLSQAKALLESTVPGSLLTNLHTENTLPLFLANNANTLFSPEHQGSSAWEIQTIALDWLSLENQEEANHLETKPYLQARERFEKEFAGREYFMENLMVTLFFHLNLPNVESTEKIWESYLDFCNLYSIYRFAAVMSCREGAPGDKAELFHLLVHVNRSMLHRLDKRTGLQERLFQNNSASLAHMAILLSS